MKSRTGRQASLAAFATVFVLALAWAARADDSATLVVESTPPTGLSIGSSTGHGGTTNYYTSKAVAQGASVNLSAPATDPSGYAFSQWTVNGTAQPAGQKSITFTMPAGATAVAEYRQVNIRVPSVTTSDGRVFKDVKVLRVEGDKVLLSHSGGGAWVPLDFLSDEARQSLGLRTRAEQAAYDAAQPAGGPSRPGGSAATPEKEQMMALLDKEIKEIDFQGVSLQEAIETIRNTADGTAELGHKVRIILDPAPAQNFRGVRFTLHVTKIRLCNLLQFILRPMKLDFTLSRGGIYISTPEGCIQEGGAALQKELANLEAAAGVLTPKELEALLDQPLKRAVLPAGISLGDAVEMLKLEMDNKVNFVLDNNPALNIAAISLPGVSLTDTTLRKTLQIMLLAPKLDFVISHGAIYISTPERCAQESGQTPKASQPATTPTK